MNDLSVLDFTDEQKQIVKAACEALSKFINTIIEAIKTAVTWLVDKLMPLINTKALHLARHAKKWRTRKKNAKRIFDTRRNT